MDKDDLGSHKEWLARPRKGSGLSAKTRMGMERFQCASERRRRAEAKPPSLGCARFRRTAGPLPDVQNLPWGAKMLLSARHEGRFLAENRRRYAGCCRKRSIPRNGAVKTEGLRIVRPQDTRRYQNRCRATKVPSSFLAEWCADETTPSRSRPEPGREDEGVMHVQLPPRR